MKFFQSLFPQEKEKERQYKHNRTWSIKGVMKINDNNIQ